MSPFFKRRKSFITDTSKLFTSPRCCFEVEISITRLSIVIGPLNTIPATIHNGVAYSKVTHSMSKGFHIHRPSRFPSSGTVLEYIRYSIQRVPLNIYNLHNKSLMVFKLWRMGFSPTTNSLPLFSLRLSYWKATL